MFSQKLSRQAALVRPLVAALLLVPGVATAQKAHYWTNQYGTRAELLGGPYRSLKLILGFQLAF